MIQEQLITLRKHLDSPLGFDVVRVAHPSSFQCDVDFVCLISVSYVQRCLCL
jgi:hypothetical protein